MDQSRNLSQPISDVEPKEVEPEVVEKVKPNHALTIVFVIVILGLLGFLTYAFLTGKLDIGIKSPLISEEEEKKDSECTECEVCENCTDSSYVLKNSGWAVYDLDKYEFSAELPTNNFVQSVDGNEVISFWKVGVVDLSTLKGATYGDWTLYTDYKDKISIQFIPDDATMFECGGGCAKEHNIDIHVFENKGSKSLSDVSNIYIENLRNRSGLDHDPIISQKEEQKWGKTVMSYTEEVQADIPYIYGDIVVTPKFVYAVRYYLSSTPTESNQIAQKVLDSFEFGK